MHLGHSRRVDVVSPEGSYESETQINESQVKTSLAVLDTCHCLPGEKKRQTVCQQAKQEELNLTYSEVNRGSS